MSDTSPEFIGAASPPSISATGNAEYDRLLADRDFKERFPEQYAALEQSVTAARATIGFKGPPADPRTPEERFHDQRYGVEPRSAADYAELQLPDKMQLDGGVSGAEVLEGAKEFAAALSLPPDLARVVIDDALTKEPLDPSEGARIFGADRYADMLKSAQAVIDRSARLTKGTGRINASDLPAHALSQLAIWSRHLQQHQQTRPR